MHFSPSEQQEIFLQSVEKYLRNEYGFDQRQEQLQRGGYDIDEARWRQFAELGWLALPVAEARGGFSGRLSDVVLFMETLGEGLVCEPVFANSLLSAYLLSLFPGSERAEQLLAQLLAGESRVALACFEVSQALSRTPASTRIEQVAGQGQLNGHKVLVLGAPVAQRLLVSAADSSQPGGVALLDIAIDRPGIEILPHRTVDGGSAAEIRLHQVSVSAEDYLRTEALDSTAPCRNVAAALDYTLDRAAIALCAEAVGIMQRLLWMTVDYCKQRQQFGRPLAQFQVLQHRMVDMFIEYQQAKSMVYRAATMVDEGEADLNFQVSAVKARVGMAARFVGQEAVQLHGGMGLTDELVVSHYFKRLTVIDQSFGNHRVHLQRYSDLLAR